MENKHLLVALIIVLVILLIAAVVLDAANVEFWPFDLINTRTKVDEVVVAPPENKADAAVKNTITETTSTPEVSADDVVNESNGATPINIVGEPGEPTFESTPVAPPPAPVAPPVVIAPPPAPVAPPRVIVPPPVIALPAPIAPPVVVKPTVPSILVSNNRRYLFYPGMDSTFGDIGKFAGTREQLAAQCSSRADCLGFNTNGFLKKTISDEANWVKWTTDPTRGFYVDVRTVDARHFSIPSESEINL